MKTTIEKIVGQKDISDDLLERVIASKPSYYVDETGKTISVAKLRTILSEIDTVEKRFLFWNEEDFKKTSYHQEGIELEIYKAWKIRDIYGTYITYGYKTRVAKGNISEALDADPGPDFINTIETQSSPDSDVPKQKTMKNREKMTSGPMVTLGVVVSAAALGFLWRIRTRKK